MVGKAIQEKLVEFASDIQSILEQNEPEQIKLILDQIKENVRTKKLYKLNYTKKDQIKQIDIEDAFTVSDNIVTEQKVQFPYISLKSILLDAFGHKKYFEDLKKFSCSWEQSEKYKEIHKGEMNEIHLSIYGDEITLTEALSHRSVGHHYYMLYGSFLNIPQEKRSSENSIFLISMINTNMLKKIGINAFLRPLVDEIALLKKFKYRGELFSLKLGVICADTPASQELGGNYLN